MGNVNGGNRPNHQSPPQPQPPPNQYGSASSSSPYPNPNPLQYYPHQGYYPPLSSPSLLHQGQHRVPFGSIPSPSLPYVEHQKAVTIRNDINLNKQTLRFEPDELNPGKFLVSFTFDATVSGSITVMFFAEEGEECNLVATREDLFPSSTVSFPEGHGQRFKQACGTGIDFSGLSEMDLVEASERDVYHLAVKAESAEDDPLSKTRNRQITLAVLEMEKGEYKARVVKQILWVNGSKYVLQEIYGIGNTVDVNGDDGNEIGKECVICLTEPRDTTVLPCRHMCMCSGCAKLLRFQTNLCPICRQPVDRLLEIKVNNTSVTN